MRDGISLELPPSKKARALLGYLVASARAHNRDFLASLLWEEREDARGALRWSLSRLRPLVDAPGEERLIADRDQVELHRSGIDIDLLSVREALRDGIDRVATTTLESAAAKFRGELLEGLDLTESYAFHAWCIAEREAARALRLSILQALVARLAEDPERALPHARAQLELDPLAGTAQAAVVRILGALGRTREAEELYGSFKAMLMSRLGERTSVELERARMALRTRPAAADPLPVAPRPILLSRLARTPFVGRASELATLTSLLDTATSGQGCAVELSGEAGVGKSRLVEELAHQAHLRGARVLVGRCVEGDASPAFLPFFDSLDAAIVNDGELERLAGADASLAARVLPRLAGRIEHAPVPTDATSERYLVFQAVATLLERVAAPAGALLVIEDLHWSDQPSLALLRYLAGRLHRSRLLVVSTYRDEGLAERHHEALADLRRHGSTRVALRGLAGDEIRAMITSLAGESVPVDLRERLARETAGHPLFLQEILKHLVEENALAAPKLDALQIPDTVRQVITRRLARLSDPARRLLTNASAMVGEFRWELVREVCNDPEDALLDALDEVLGAQLLRERVVAGVASYQFSHALVAQTLHEALPMPRRIRLHRGIGEAIERVYAHDLEPHLEALAHHYLISASDVADVASRGKAADYATRAAEHAIHLVAFEQAARLYLRAISLTGPTDHARLAGLYRKRGSALAIVSAWNEACEAYETALRHASPEEREWRAEVLVELGSASLWAMDIPSVAAHAREAESLTATLGREDLTLAVGAMVGQCLASDGKVAAAIEKYSEVRAMKRDRHVPSMVLSPLTLYWNGRVGESIEWSGEMLATARSANDIVALLVGLPPLGMALASHGRYREALDVFAEARRTGERVRAQSFLARAVSMSTGLHIDLGDIDTAEDLATEARELARLADWSPGDVNGGIDQVVCRLLRDDIGAAERLLEELSARVSTMRAGFHDWLWAMRLAWARAETSAARRDGDAVERWCAETLRLASGNRLKYELAALVTRARVRTGHAALADLDRAIAIAREIGDPALFVRAAAPRIAIDGTAELAAELAHARARITSD